MTIKVRLSASTGGRTLTRQRMPASADANSNQRVSNIIAGMVVRISAGSSTSRKRGKVLFREVRDGTDCCLVELASSLSKWIPTRRLKSAEPPSTACRNEHCDPEGAGAALILSFVARALSAPPPFALLGDCDIDPLPHQQKLVIRLLRTASPRCIIGEDVGMGKTIEYGLVLREWLRSGQVRRVLLLCPAALMRQLQQELLEKFGLAFRIYGSDFEADEQWKWTGLNLIIASFDRVKPNEAVTGRRIKNVHFNRLLSAEPFDLVLVDEAHHLAGGSSFEPTNNYQLLRALSARTPRVILVTATPHKGVPKEFRRFVTALRSDFQESIDDVDATQAALGEVILRNRKSSVADTAGTPLFVGHTIQTIPLTPTTAMRAVADWLLTYPERMRSVDAAPTKAGGSGLNLILSTFRKLLDSSPAALLSAVEKRLRNLGHGLGKQEEKPIASSRLGKDVMHGAAVHEQETDAEREVAPLVELRALCLDAQRSDTKRVAIRLLTLELVVRRGCKLVLFTEYRATQRQLVHDISDLLGYSPPQIHGEMSYPDRQRAVAEFNERAAVLVCTDAASEGLNLHESCHIIVNADIPWNPARIAQRTGRVYRYGQQKHVQVLNLVVRGMNDDRVLAAGVERVDVISRDLAKVSSEYEDDFKSGIFGNLTEPMDLAAAIASILDDRFETGRDPQTRPVEHAGRPACISAGTEPESGDGPSTSILMRFIEKAGPKLEAQVRVLDKERQHVQVYIPPALISAYPEFGHGVAVDATTLRKTANESGGQIKLLSVESSFTRHLIQTVLNDAPLIHYAVVRAQGLNGSLVAFSVRWANGGSASEEVRIVHWLPSGEIKGANSALERLLGGQWTAQTVGEMSPARRDSTSAAMLSCMNRYAAEQDRECNQLLGIEVIGVVDLMPFIRENSGLSGIS